MSLGKIKPVTTNDQIISITEIFLTCLEITGVLLPNDAGEDSVSFLNCLLGKQVGPFHEPSEFLLRQNRQLLQVLLFF